MWLKSSPPPPPHNFFNGPSLNTTFFMDFHFAYRPRISLDSGVISFFFYFFSYLLFLSLKKTIENCTWKMQRL